MRPWSLLVLLVSVAAGLGAGPAAAQGPVEFTPLIVSLPGDPGPVTLAVAGWNGPADDFLVQFTCMGSDGYPAGVLATAGGWPADGPGDVGITIQYEDPSLLGDPSSLQLLVGRRPADMVPNNAVVFVVQGPGCASGKWDFLGRVQGNDVANRHLDPSEITTSADPLPSSPPDIFDRFFPGEWDTGTVSPEPGDPTEGIYGSATVFEPPPPPDIEGGVSPAPEAAGTTSAPTAEPAGKGSGGLNGLVVLVAIVGVLLIGAAIAYVTTGRLRGRRRGLRFRYQGTGTLDGGQMELQVPDDLGIVHTPLVVEEGTPPDHEQQPPRRRRGLRFRYQADGTMGGGEVEVEVPDGWTAPGDAQETGQETIEPVTLTERDGVYPASVVLEEGTPPDHEQQPPGRGQGAEVRYPKPSVIGPDGSDAADGGSLPLSSNPRIVQWVPAMGTKWKYICVYITDERGENVFVDSIELDPDQSAVEWNGWTPDRTGTYTIEIFGQRSLEDPTADDISRTTVHVR